MCRLMCTFGGRVIATHPHDVKKMKEKNVKPMMTYVPPEKLDAPAASPDAQEHPASES